jgi:hypothetical protein
LKMSNAIDG